MAPSKIFASSNSLAIIIPKQYTDQFNLKAGDYIILPWEHIEVYRLSPTRRKQS